MYNKYQLKMLEISRILFLNNVPVVEAKIIGSFIEELIQENQKSKEIIGKAVDIARKYGQIDGDHHQKWVTDQMVRALLGSDYENFVKDYEEDDDYEWDCSIKRWNK